MNKLSLPVLALALAGSAHAQLASCSSDAVPQPAALLERFISADCERCWADAQTPDAAAGTLAIDWVAPGSRGDDAPLAAVATTDAVLRLQALRKPAPAAAASHFTRRSEGAPRLRVAHGLPVNDYIGTSIELPPGGGPWRAWLLLVETLPRGAEGTPVERNLVRNAFTADWPAGAKAARYELRPMHIAEGAKPERLRVVGWIEDSRGRVRSIAQSQCGKE